MQWKELLLKLKTLPFKLQYLFKKRLEHWSPFKYLSLWSDLVSSLWLFDELMPNQIQNLYISNFSH